MAPRSRHRRPAPVPTSPRHAALDLLGRVRRGAFAAPELDRALRTWPARRDRALITDLVYGTVRHLVYLEACLEVRLRAPGKLPARVMNALYCGSYEILVRGTPRRAAVNEWVATLKALEPAFSGLANAVLRRVDEPEALPPHQQLSLPRWLHGSFVDALGEELAERSGRAMLTPEPLWLSALREGAREQLEAEGCTVRSGPVVDSLAVRCPKPVYSLGPFKAGLVQPQNPASRLPVMVLDARPGERVLDLAGGGGVKAAQLAAAGARVVSVDRDRGKLARAQANFDRLGLHGEHVHADLTTAPPLPAARGVLLDAPCSGSGTLRGHPEIKLRLRPGDLDGLSRLQSTLLQTAAALTLPGGRLVYAVCSLTAEEGPEVVKAFTEAVADFAVVPAPIPVPHRSTRYGTFILPENGLDGFFVARLERS